MLSRPQSVRNLLTVSALTKLDIMELLGLADHYKRVVCNTGTCDDLKGSVMTSLFYEPSTRTSCSFKAAMLRLGGSVLDVDINSSSVKKGESLEDTVQTLSSYSDCIVMRHPERHSVHQAANYSKVPVINAGDGIGEHPSQALLDLYTIYLELGIEKSPRANPQPLKIGLVGDLKHGRTVHSLIQCLTKINNKIMFYLISPETLKLPNEYLNDYPHFVESKLENCISDLDVLYVTRIQKERFSIAQEYDAVKNSYIIDQSLMKQAKEQMIVMHPLPRLDEIAKDVDQDPRAAYFRQVKYGMYMRMAILSKFIMKIQPHRPVLNIHGD